MDLSRIRNLFTGEKYHDLLLDAFEMGNYIIIYGSIFVLTILGIITWVFGSLNLFSLILKLVDGWNLSYDTAALTMQQLQTGVILLLDLYLLSVVLFIVAFGLYGIFIKKGKEGIPLPVNITRISHLERYLFGTIVAILLVAALNKILYPEGTASTENAIIIGMICAVILVISIYLAVQHSRDL
jgi:uncharacterized membrane protein YqhA